MVDEWEYKKRYYRKDGKVRKILKCEECEKLLLRRIYTNRSFTSGDLYVYECKCGNIERVML